MTQPDLTAIDSGTLRVLLRDSQDIERIGNESMRPLDAIRDEIDDAEQAAHWRTRNHYVDETTDRWEAEQPEPNDNEWFTIIDSGPQFNFDRYGDLVIQAHRLQQLVNAGAEHGRRAFAIKRELIRRGDWP